MAEDGLEGGSRWLRGDGYRPRWISGITKEFETVLMNVVVSQMEEGGFEGCGGSSDVILCT